MPDKVEIIAELKDLVSGKMDEINASISKMETNLNKAGGAGSGMQANMTKGVLSANLMLGALKGAGSAALDFEKDAIKSFSNFEQFQTSLTTMFHGNKEEAKMLSAQLQKFATETPFELTEIQAATKQMIAFGSTSGGVVEEMRILGDVSSGIGAPLGDIAYLYGTIRTSGRAMTMDINQFANRGIPIWKELEKITGKSGTALRKLVEEGKIGFPEIEKAFKNMTTAGGQFAGMMDEQSKTLGGKISNMGDAWEQLKVNIGSQQSGILKETINWASDMINAVNQSMSSTNNIEEAVGHSINSSKLMSYIKGVGWGTSAIFTGAYGMGKSAQAFKGAADSGNRDELLGVQGKIDNILLGAKDKETALAAKKNLEYEKLLSSQRMQSGLIDKETMYDEFKMLNFNIKKLDERAKIKGGAVDTKGGALGTGAADKLDVLAKANRPTQYYITIKEQIHEVNITPASMKEGVQEITSMLSKGLMMAVNDISVLDNQR